jgi:signal transduction histidine kinase
LTIAKDAHVIADEGLLNQVLENLLRNAWKYTARREEAEIEFGFREEPAGTVYFVRDNGVGFDPRYADLLFRPFQRLHSQSDFPGTGVGLATVQRIITRHGGKIWAQGGTDQGAEFSFTLPGQAES